jgi:predicted outer membrane lipoprotein
MTSTNVSLRTEVSPPSYQVALDWMKELPARHVTFDIWARGNFMRRVIHHADEMARPLIVPFRYVNQMRWAYRRLAMLGSPVDFIYTGRVSKPKLVVHLWSASAIIGQGGGYGYDICGGSRATVGGKEWVPIVGRSRLMPEDIVDWIVDEAPDAFVSGKVFVAPAELVGIDIARPEPGTRALGEVAQGCRVASSAQAAANLLQLELPYIDNMTPQNFQKFLLEHENDLIRFRAAFRKLSADTKAEDLTDILDEIRSEVAEIGQAERYASLRKTTSALGGVVATFAASVAAALAGPPDCALPIGAAAGAAAAAGVLTSLWKERYEMESKRRESSYYILWKLGVDKPAKVRRCAAKPSEGRPSIKDAFGPETFPGVPKDLHWLTPPNRGFRFPTVVSA